MPREIVEANRRGLATIATRAALFIMQRRAFEFEFNVLNLNLIARPRSGPIIWRSARLSAAENIQITTTERLIWASRDNSPALPFERDANQRSLETDTAGVISPTSGVSRCWKETR